jgi:uncharacterized protein YrrD
MRLKELRGLPVVEPTAARKIGTVADYQVDSSSGRLAALDLGPADGSGTPERVPAHAIRRVGRHAVMLTGRAALGSGPPDSSERWLSSDNLAGLEVLGDDGNRIGHLADAIFNQDTLEVEAYLLGGLGLFGRLFGRRGRLEPASVASCSQSLMIVTTGHLNERSTATSAANGDGAVPLADAAVGASETVRVPLKLDDRAPLPSAGGTRDGQPVATSHRDSD